MSGCGCPLMDEETELEVLLRKRELTHGNFSSNASVSQALKSVLHGAPGWQRLPPVARESFDLICTKISRAITGDPLHADHYVDIAGYAQLIADLLTEIRKAKLD